MEQCALHTQVDVFCQTILQIEMLIEEGVLKYVDGILIYMIRITN